MIRPMGDLPGNVVGLEAVGEVRAGDYEGVLDPAANAALDQYDKIRLLYVLGDEFEGYSGGAMWEDARVGVAHWSKWEKLALVTDNTAYENAVKAFAWMMPCELRVFGTADLADAKAWVAD